MADETETTDTVVVIETAAPTEAPAPAEKPAPAPAAAPEPAPEPEVVLTFNEKMQAAAKEVEDAAADLKLKRAANLAASHALEDAAAAHQIAKDRRNAAVEAIMRVANEA